VHGCPVRAVHSFLFIPFHKTSVHVY
jgi:hypothetical protein